MLYCVSYSNGVVGVFSSMEKITELVLNRYPSIAFVIQVFNNSKKSILKNNTDKHINEENKGLTNIYVDEKDKNSVESSTDIYVDRENELLTEENHVKSPTVWVVIYRNADTVAFVSDNKEEASKSIKVLNMIGKSYEDDIDFWESKIDKISECVENILDSLQRIYGENGVVIDSSDNIIYYV